MPVIFLAVSVWINRSGVNPGNTPRFGQARVQIAHRLGSWGVLRVLGERQLVLQESVRPLGGDGPEAAGALGAPGRADNKGIDSLGALAYYGFHRGHWTDPVTGLDQGLRMAIECEAGLRF